MSQAQVELKNKSFLEEYTYKGTSQKIEDIISNILKGTEKVGDLLGSQQDVVYIAKYVKNNKVYYYLIDDWLDDIKMLVRSDNEDIERIVNKVFRQVQQQLSRFFGSFDGNYIGEESVIFYRKSHNAEGSEEPLESFTLYPDMVKVELGNYERYIERISVELTRNKTYNRYGVRVYVSLYDVMAIIRDHIYKNYERVDISDE